MNTCFVLLDDAEALERNAELIRKELQQLWHSEVQAFAPVLFAESSCLTQFVEEEIDFAVTGQHRAGGARMGFDEFVAHWEWEEKLSMKVSSLSGGWRKLLGLTLFLNRRSPNLLIVDLATHLSDTTIGRFIRKTGGLDIAGLALVEYDYELLRPHLPDAVALRHSARGLEPAES